jgi:hypothetical protein
MQRLLSLTTGSLQEVQFQSYTGRSSEIRGGPHRDPSRISIFTTGYSGFALEQKMDTT